MNKKVLLSSLMSVALLASIATGATYALFTSEDKVNVNVTAGKVNVTAKVNETFKIKSLDTELKEVTGKGTFSTGGTAEVDAEGNITLNKIVPGDRVEFVVNVKNDSNVKVNFRSTVAVEEGLELFSGLKITIDDEVYNSGMTTNSPWKLLNPNDGNKDVKVTIELPENAGNEYQEKSTKLTYSVSAIQGNHEVADDTDPNTTYIYNETDLRLLAMSVNKGNSYAGKNVKLMADINLANKEWTPIGTSAKPFKGHFDGNGKIVSNLKITENANASDVGLFGFTTDGSIKNLTVNNAEVKGYLDVAVVAGTPYTSTYTNIAVTGNVKVNGFAYVGGVFGKNVYANVSDITVNVKDGSYVYADSISGTSYYRTYVGGVMGFMGEGGHEVSNVTSNIDVYGTVCDIGGITGIAHYGNKFTNITATGDVYLLGVSPDAGDYTEIGGIAGVWHNQTGYSVTLTNVKFEGELNISAPEGVELSNDLYYGGLVGTPYSTSGNGSLIVDGNVAVDSFQELFDSITAGDELIELASDVKGVAATTNGYGATGLRVLPGQTLDGNGYTLSVNNANTTWDSAIYVKGGTVKNITIQGAFRGISVTGATDDVLIDNVVIKGVTYTIHTDDGYQTHTLTVKNSELYGWTSYAEKGFANYVFENCYFGEGNGYKFMRPYGVTELKNCNFVKGYQIDAQAKVTLENCYLDGVLITADNVATLVTGNTANAVVR